MPVSEGFICSTSVLEAVTQLSWRVDDPKKTPTKRTANPEVDFFSAPIDGDRGAAKNSPSVFCGDIAVPAPYHAAQASEQL